MTDSPKDLTEHDKMIGQNIKVYRAQRGASQTDLGNAIGVSTAQVYKYESGKSHITLERAYRIARALDVTLKDLLTGVRLETKPIPKKRKEREDDEEDGYFSDRGHGGGPVPAEISFDETLQKHREKNGRLHSTPAGPRPDPKRKA